MHGILLVVRKLGAGEGLLELILHKVNLVWLLFLVTHVLVINPCYIIYFVNKCFHLVLFQPDF